jgi:hypothetical protein
MSGQTVRLTAAQASALECSGVDVAPDEHEQLVLDAWVADREFVVHEEFRDRVVSALIELANAEDAMAENRALDPALRAGARGACRALSNLIAKL